MLERAAHLTEGWDNSPRTLLLGSHGTGGRARRRLICGASGWWGAASRGVPARISARRPGHTPKPKEVTKGRLWCGSEPPNGSRLSCGRSARGRKELERQTKRLAGEATQFSP